MKTIDIRPAPLLSRYFIKETHHERDNDNVRAWVK